MRNETRLVYNALIAQVATLNGVPDAGVKFSVNPVVEQKLEEVIQQSSEFLGMVNIITVPTQEGDKVGFGVTRPIASRTATDSKTGKRRHTVDPTDTGDKGRYRCEQTNSDVGIRYAKLDMWAHKPEFQTLYRDTIVKQQGRDRIMIGWNGVNCAATTDIVAFPLLQDVNYGWLHKIRTYAPERVLDDGALSAGGTKAIYVSASGILYNEDEENEEVANVDYVNLDALVHDATELLDEWHRDDTDLVVIVGRDLVHDKYHNIISAAGDTATEMEARDRILTLPKQIGGKRAVMVPFFPANALLITSLDNLSIYVQAETRRRQMKDEPEFDQVADYQSVNECYVVEDYGRTSLVENIVMGKKPA
jgi:P2 family phage major capsid protein